MEKLDEMEFNPVQQPQLNEKVLKDKRKAAWNIWTRILRLYEKENQIFTKVRKLEVEYEQKRAQLSQYFDTVRNAQHVEVEGILCKYARLLPTSWSRTFHFLGPSLPPSLKTSTLWTSNSGSFYTSSSWTWRSTFVPWQETSRSSPRPTSSSSLTSVWPQSGLCLDLTRRQDEDIFI